MIDYNIEINQFAVFFGGISILSLLIVYFYNKKTDNGRMYISLAIIYTTIQIAYRVFLYYFKIYGIIGDFSKFSIAHLYYNNIYFLLASLVLCFLLTYIMLRTTHKIKGNVNYVGLLLLLIGLYTGIL